MDLDDMFEFFGLEDEEDYDFITVMAGLSMSWNGFRRSANHSLQESWSSR